MEQGFAPLQVRRDTTWWDLHRPETGISAAYYNRVEEKKCIQSLWSIPMREELTRLGIKELRTVAEVDQAIPNQPGTTMVVVNSICGCAAGRMRPAVRAALQHASRPEKMFTVFAGQDKDATDRARSYFAGYPALVALDRIAA